MQRLSKKSENKAAPGGQKTGQAHTGILPHGARPLPLKFLLSYQKAGRDARPRARFFAGNYKQRISSIYSSVPPAMLSRVLRRHRCSATVAAPAASAGTQPDKAAKDVPRRQ